LIRKLLCFNCLLVRAMMAGIPWQRFEGEKIGQKYSLTGLASISGDQAWFHASDPARPGDDVAVVCMPEHKRGWLSSIAELKHPSLRVILGAGKCVVQGVAIRYCAMEPAGPTLAERLPWEAPLSVTVVRELVGHVIGALAVLRDNHLVSCQLTWTAGGSWPTSATPANRDGWSLRPQGACSLRRLARLPKHSKE
jgi:hypothetical protein